jgi:AraC family transcriptional regulator of adaptative response/methylated-DNA-[protein]-cysteine methyltransferase
MTVTEKATTAQRFDSDEDRWRAVCTRSRKADGRFVFAVRTTGVYCRPSCAARRPRRENVVFLANPAAAKAAGFRACKRCHPDRSDDPEGDPIARACAIVSRAHELPRLAELGAAVGLSPFHFHRRFKAAVGLTPKAYIEAERARRMRDGLPVAASVTASLYEAGYGSSSRFYETSQARLGMRPSTYRHGGKGIEIRYATATCTLGAVVVAATGRGICAIELGDTAAAGINSLERRFPHARLCAGDDALQHLVEAAVAAVERPDGASSLPLDVQGTAFQEQVWRALRAIPPGETTTYADLARRLGRPTATRAVAAAVAANPIAVVVPCHRVVRGDGSLGGYRWGTARKKQLLAREAPVQQRRTK